VSNDRHDLCRSPREGAKLDGAVGQRAGRTVLDALRPNEAGGAAVEESARTEDCAANGGERGLADEPTQPGRPIAGRRVHTNWKSSRA
jgi:hypothetical protein